MKIRLYKVRRSKPRGSEVRFAWFPKVMDNKTIVWLEKYRRNDYYNY